MPITPHTIGELLLKRSSSYSQFATSLLVVLSVNCDGIDISALTSKGSSNFLNGDTYRVFVLVIVISIRTNRARCTLNRKIRDLLNKESISGESSGRVKFDKKSYRECLKM